MKKVKYITLIFALLLVGLVIPNISNAANIYSDTEQGIEWEYEVDDDNNIINLNLKTKTALGNIEIPSTIEGKTVISLKGSDVFKENAAFQNCTGITGITIPNTLISIAEDAFHGCTGLKTIEIPDSVKILENSAFHGCTGLKTIEIPDSVKILENSAFDSCTGLKTIVLPKNLIQIGDYAFSSCSGLESLKIPNTVTSIGRHVFSNCSGLKEIILSENLSKIPEGAFINCSNIKSIILPNSVTTIEGGDMLFETFRECTSLEKLLIPDTVATITGEPFEGCDKLTIYGNDGMKSKEYAEEHGIPFDYIANWDKDDSGDDITSPTVENIQVTYSSVENYSKDEKQKMYIIPSEAKLTINVKFNESIEGSIAPTLTIKFGNGENIALTNGTIGNSMITYTYTIKSTDKGAMSAINLEGGDIKDDSGNEAILSCPNLSIESSSGFSIYANGTITDSDNDNTNGEKPNNGNTDKDNSGDDTIFTGKFPNTGLTIGIVLLIFMVFAICILSYIKFNKFKGI